LNKIEIVALAGIGVSSSEFPIDQLYFADNAIHAASANILISILRFQRLKIHCKIKIKV